MITKYYWALSILEKERQQHYQLISGWIYLVGLSVQTDGAYANPIIRAITLYNFIYSNYSYPLVFGYAHLSLLDNGEPEKCCCPALSVRVNLSRNTTHDTQQTNTVFR